MLNKLTVKNFKLILLLIVGFPCGASSHFLATDANMTVKYESNLVMTRIENEVDYKAENEVRGTLELKFKMSNNNVLTEVIF